MTPCRPAQDRRVRGDLLRIRCFLGADAGVGVIADDDVEVIVRPVDDGVRAVFAHAAVEAVQERYFVDLVRTFCVTTSIQSGPLGAVADEQERVIDPAHAMTGLDLRAVVGHVLQDPFLVGLRAEQDAFALVGDEQPAARVEGHVDERERPAIAGVLDRRDDLEAGLGGEGGGFR